MFEKYSKLIFELKNFEKTDILNKDFELYSKSNLKIYYAPHNEIINKNAKVFIVGITPGWTQTSIAYKTAYKGLQNDMDFDEIKKECKRNSRFAGSMRKNLIEMLDEINLNDKLGIESCSKLFDENDNLLHTTSLIPYPVFINNKNYTGSNPKIMDNEILSNYVKKYFYNEISVLSDVLIIPLGKSVEEVLNNMVEDKILKKEQCLFGFPHPSGANGHRKVQFEQNKSDLSIIVENYFKNYIKFNL